MAPSVKATRVSPVASSMPPTANSAPAASPSAGPVGASRTQTRVVAEKVRDVKPLADADYRPDVMTPLIDASVKIIRATEEAVAARGDATDVVVVIQTDGQENCSVEYDAGDLALLVKEKEQAGWQFVFLGAGRPWKEGRPRLVGRGHPADVILAGAPTPA